MTVSIFRRHPQRAAALENGELIDVTEVAREDTFTLPVAFTRRAWHAVIAPGANSLTESSDQNEEAHVRHVLRIAYNEIQNRWDEDLTRLQFTVPQHQATPSLNPTTVIIVSTTDDDGNLSLTIGLPGEFGHPELRVN